MVFKKETGNDALLAAIEGGSIDNALKGGNLISDKGVASENDREAIRLINEKAAQITKYAVGESGKLRMVNEIIKSGMWEMYFDESGQINRVNWSDEFRKMIGYRDRSDFPDTLDAWTSKLHPDDKDI